MDASHTTNGHVTANLARRESLGSQNSQTAKEYALPPTLAIERHTHTKSNNKKVY